MLEHLCHFVDRDEAAFLVVLEEWTAALFDHELPDAEQVGGGAEKEERNEGDGNPLPGEPAFYPPKAGPPGEDEKWEDFEKIAVERFDGGEHDGDRHPDPQSP